MHQSALRGGKRHQRTIARTTSRDPHHAQSTVARIAETMAGRDFGQALEEIGYSNGRSLRTRKMGSVDALTAMMVDWKSTTTLRNDRCARWLLAERITCSRDPTEVEKAPRRSTA